MLPIHGSRTPETLYAPDFYDDSDTDDLEIEAVGLDTGEDVDVVVNSPSEDQDAVPALVTKQKVANFAPSSLNEIHKRRERLGTPTLPRSPSSPLFPKLKSPTDRSSVYASSKLIGNLEIVKAEAREELKKTAVTTTLAVTLSPITSSNASTIRLHARLDLATHTATPRLKLREKAKIELIPLK
jgi:hypothetical protein